MNSLRAGAILLLVSTLLLACTSRDKNGKVVDTPVSGHIRIAVDESLRPLIDAELDVFGSTYTQTNIEPLYVSEEEAINLLLEDSVRMAIVTRKLTENERQQIEIHNIIPKEHNIATGAAALIVNRSNTDTLLTITQLKEILEGKISNWNQINPKSAATPMVVVFDKPASGMARLLIDSVAKVKTLPDNFFAVNTNEEVLNYVIQTPGALGVIGVEWISDEDDATANKFLSTVRVMELAKEGGDKYYKPFQGYLATGDYPLTRNTLVISREARTGLGTGFVQFLTSEKGQRIVLKAGLVPVTMPVRLVEFKRQPVQYE